MTDYDKLIREDDPYSRLIQDEQAQALRGAMAGAASTQPDVEAKLAQLAKRVGAPVDSVRLNPTQAERQATIGSIDYDRLVRENPVTADFLTKQAAVARDDVSVLTRMERAFSAFGQGITKGSLQDELAPLHYKAMTGEITPAEQARRRELSDQMKALDARPEKGDSPLSWFLNVTGYTGRQLVTSVREGGVGALAGAGAGAGAAAAVGQLGPQVAVPEEIVTVPGAAIFGARTGYITASTVYNYKAEAGFAFDEFEALKDVNGKPISRDVAQGAAAAVGLINAGLETLGDVALLKLIPGLEKVLGGGAKDAVKALLARPTFRAAVAQAGKKWAKAATIEGVTEGVQEITVILGRELSKGVSPGKFESVPIGQDVERVLQAAAEGAAGAAGVGAPVTAYQAGMNIREVRIAQRNQDFMNALGESAQASKLRERLPEAFRDFVQKAREGAPVENVYIPADQFARYFQSQNVDPAAVAAEVGATNFGEAMAAGTDIVIPLENYAEKLAATQHHSGLLQDVKLHQGDLTMREAKALEQRQQELQAELEAMIDIEEGRADKPAVEQIKQEAMGELVGRYERGTAEAYATTYAKAIGALASRAGVDPMELHRTYGLRVVTPLPEILQRQPNIDTAIDPLLDRLRASDIPTEAKALGPSLYEFVRDRGGLKPIGEVRQMDEGIERRPFQRKLSQETGVGIDRALEAAIEAGYFPGADLGQLSEADMLDALDADISGNRIYSMQFRDENLAGIREQLMSLQEYIDQIGGDVANMDNATLKAMIMRAAQTPAEDGQQFDQADEGDKRGFIQFGADRKFTIGLLEKADLSTFLHETGHFWLEVLGDLSERQGAADQIKADYQTLLDWFGVKSRAEITVEHHEKFARANEAYLMEGKAPSQELRGIFQRFRAWLSLIYRTMDRLNVKLNDDVRAVFDRIYATDEEIDAAKSQLDLQPLFAKADEAGLSQAEFDAYQRAVQQSTEQAKEDLQVQLMREYQREREKWWKDRAAETRMEVEAELDAMPVYMAFDALAKGQLPDGTAIKLSKADLVRRYGEEYLKRLPRGFKRIYSLEGGTSADVAAEAFGFESGSALIEALVNMRPRNELIKAETDARMAERFGDMRLDGTIADKAMNALHGEMREKVLATELQILNRQLGRRGADAPAAVFRAAAAARIGQMQAKDINPGQYLLAERRASRAAYEAAAKKDYQAAAAEKQRELMNHHLYLEAAKAKQEIDKLYAYMGRFEKSATREKLAKAGADYLDQIDAILERYEFKRVSLTALSKRQSLLDFVQDMETQGLLVNIPDALLDEARRVNYRQATMDELRAVRDTVKNIEHLATLKNKLLRKREAIEFDAVKDELIESARENFKPTGELGRPNRKGETVRDRGARLWKWFDAKHLKVEQLVEWLDGGKINGPWARYLFDQAADAQTKEYELHALVTAKLEKLAETMPKDWRESLADKSNIVLPGIDGPVTRYTLLSLALNTGNASNMQRLRDGYGWSDATITSALGELNADDARFVQGVWDTVNALWPEIEALEKRVSGVAPPKVDATPVTIGGVEVAGGYFPLVYDSRMSAIGEKQAEATESVGQFLANAYGRARTDKGYTKQRVETLKAPVMLDFEQVLTSHLTRVIKDVSHREAIYSLNKILKDGDIKAALIDTVGEEQYRELNKWVQVLVADRADTLHQATGAAKLIMQFRTNMAIVTMGWRISTMMAQFAGFGPSADLVKPRYLTQALVDFNRYGPWSSHRETLTNMVYEKSGEMKFRADTIDRDVRDSLRRMQGDNSPLAAIRKTAFYLTSMADRQVTIPTWIGAYRQALAEGKTEEDAVRAGDRAVRLSQGAGGSKDLAAVQRDNELMRLLTMYYTPFSVLYARLRDVGHTTRQVKDMPRAVARVLALVILPAVMGDLLAARGPDDDEDEVWWAIRKSLLYPVASIPVVRDLSGYLEARMIAIAGDGEMKFAPSFSLSPVVGAMDKLARLVFLRLPEAAQGQRPWDDVAWDSLEASGYVLGLPTAQVRITGEYVTDVLTDQAHPESPQQAMHDLLFKRPPERR